jgi:hypothetical protein
MSQPTKPPGGLGVRGRAFWRAVVEHFEPGVGERELLLEASRLIDLLDILEGAAREPFVPGTRGQPRANPMLHELRAARAQLAQLLGQLGLEEPPVSAHARRAARARWSVVEGGRR